MLRPLLIPMLPTLLLVARDGAPPVSPSHPVVPGPGMRQELILARLHRLRMERLQQSLGISPEKAKGIADRWEQFDLESHERRQRMRQLRQQVNGILLSSLSEDEKNTRMRPLVDQFTATRKEQNEARRRFEEDISASLTPAQQGRFIIVVEEIQHALIEAIRQQRGEDPSDPGF